MPTGDLANGAYDEAGNFYQMPENIVADPNNVLLSSKNHFVKGEGDEDATDDEEELTRRREEKGKGVLQIGELVKVKARLSDRGGPDLVISFGKEQPVCALIKRLQDEVDVRLSPLLDGCRCVANSIIRYLVRAK